MQTSGSGHAADLRLARDIGKGLLAPWHEFVGRYSGLIFSIARRYLADFDQEVQRNAYVLVLEYLYSSGLAKYDGRAALSTWVMTVARSRAIDLRRELHGRKRDPSWLQHLGEQDREIFRFYYENGEDIPTIQQRFACRGVALTAGEISRSLERIEARMDQRLRSRLAYDLYARSNGIASGSLLGYVDHLRLVLVEAEERLRPDIQLLEKRTRRVLEQVQRSMQALDAEERKVLQLHFYEQLPAPRIAAAMGLRGRRRVHTLIDRALAHLRQVVHSSAGNGKQAAHPPEEATIDRIRTDRTRTHPPGIPGVDDRARRFGPR